jgi:hypothetical protein
LAPFSTIESQYPCQRASEATHEKLLFSFRTLGDGDSPSRNARTEVEADVFVHLRDAARWYFICKQAHAPTIACMFSICTQAQSEPLSWHEADGIHSLARARDDWSHRHGGAPARRLVERPISADHDAIDNRNAGFPGA